MSAVIIMAPIVAPMVVAAWPVVSAAIVGAVGAMGYAAVSAIEAEEQVEVDMERTVDLEIGEGEDIAANMSREEELVFSKEDVTVKFRRDIRGRLKVCVTGTNKSDEELRRIGTEISGRVTQQFIYNRVVSELKSADFAIVEQEVAEDQTIKIQVRNWK